MDYAIVAVVVALAVGFLLKGLVRPRPPACHPARNEAQSEPGNVVVGASLARGLEKAKRRSS